MSGGCIVSSIYSSHKIKAYTLYSLPDPWLLHLICVCCGLEGGRCVLIDTLIEYLLWCHQLDDELVRVDWLVPGTAIMRECFSVLMWTEFEETIAIFCAKDQHTEI